VPQLFVVRHADAGHRSDWDGPDHTRPLSDRGWRQAKGLVDLLAETGVRRLLSSPYTRCVQTLEPLAERLGLAVEPDPRLTEGAGAAGPLAIDRELGQVDAVLCSHGDVIPDLLDALLRRGIRLKDDLRWQKGSTWVLTRDGEGFAKGHYLPPTA